MSFSSSHDSYFLHLPGKVLIVDDEHSILAVTSAILNTYKVKSLKAPNGESAVELMQHEKEADREVSIVILDLTMPGGMSGFETLEAMREINPEVKVIACSGYFQEGALESCQAIGFSGILAKPYTPESLLTALRKAHQDPAPKIRSRRQEAAEEENNQPMFVAAAPVEEEESPEHSTASAHTVPNDNL